MNWYLIQTKPNSHMIAARHLKYQAFEVFLPPITKTSRTTKKFTTKRFHYFKLSLHWLQARQGFLEKH